MEAPRHVRTLSCDPDRTASCPLCGDVPAEVYVFTPDTRHPLEGPPVRVVDVIVRLMPCTHEVDHVATGPNGITFGRQSLHHRRAIEQPSG